MIYIRIIEIDKNLRVELSQQDTVLFEVVPMTYDNLLSTIKKLATEIQNYLI